MKVKAAVLREFGGPMEIEELEMAEPKEHEVQVKHLACGFCHSDLSVWQGHIEHALPIVMGHEACAVVEEVGPKVTKLKPGDHVIGCFMVPCGHCFQCRRGRTNLCETTRPMFHDGNLLDGTSRYTDKKDKRVGLGSFIAGFATHSIMPEIGALKVPDHIKLPPEHLCLLGCSVPTGWGSVARVANASEGNSIGIWGCGGVGLNAISTAAMRNCNPIVAVDLEESKKKIAMEFGATHFINSSKEDPIPIIQYLTGGEGLEYVVEASGDPGAQTQAWYAVRLGGTMVATGVAPLNSETRIPMFYAVLQARTIKGHLYGDCRPTEDIPSLMEVMNKSAFKVDKLVTRTIKLEDLNEAKRAMLAREVTGRWVIKYD